MISSLISLALYTLSVNSAPCVPDATCWTTKSGGVGNAGMTSEKYSCLADGVYKQQWLGTTTCEGEAAGWEKIATLTETLRGGPLHDGMNTIGAASGLVYSDYLQGVNCPGRSITAETCSEYFVVRRYGDEDYVNQSAVLADGSNPGFRPYADIGPNCVNKGSLYDEIVMPKGCGLVAGENSKEWGCNSSHIWWMGYDNTRCSGDPKSWFSEIYALNECGHSEEWTHCGLQGHGGDTICEPGIGIRVSFYTYFEEVCGCSDDKPCSGSSSGGSGSTPSATSSGSSSSSTPAPSTSSGSGTPSGNPSGSGTPSGTPSGSGTPGSTPSGSTGSTPSGSSGGLTPNPTKAGNSGGSGSGTGSSSSSAYRVFSVIGYLLAFIIIAYS